MVFQIALPTKLTEQEKMLKDNKYPKLKKKRKMLEQLNQPKVEKPTKEIPKRKLDGTAAKEIAKKLLKQGKIHAIKVDTKEKQESGFKRATTRPNPSETPYHPYEDKDSMDTDTNSTGSAQAHSNNSNTSTNNKTSSNNGPPNNNNNNNASQSSSMSAPADLNKQKPVYESYVSSRDPHALAREETYREKKRDGKANYVNRDNVQQGYTIYVHGEKISEDMLRLGFQKFGDIRNIHVEPVKNCGFITYDTIDIANEAIVEMDKSTLNGVRLKVSLARRQPGARKERAPKPAPSLQEIEQLPTSDAWTALSSVSLEERERQSDLKREIVAYDEDDLVYDGM